MTGKISEDPDKVVDGTEKFAAASGGSNYGVLGSSLATYLASLAQTLTGKTINAASNTISNLTLAMFAATPRLDQLAAPTADVSLGGHKLTNVTDPASAQDAATKNYVDTVAQGINAKPSVKAATTANITLSGTQTVDGVALVAGDRCLVKNQTTSSQNGLYVVASGAWTRATDADVWSELVGAFTIVEQGTINIDTGWLSTVSAGGTLETTAVGFSQFAGIGTYSAGAGLALTGSQFSVNISGASAAAAVSDTDTILASQGAGPLKQTFAAIKTWAQGFLVSGPGSAVSANFATFNGTTGRLIQDSGLGLSIDGTFAANSDSLLPSQKAVKTYVASVTGSASATPVPPKGRLTLQTLTPVMSTSQSGKTTVYYTPHVGNIVPIYNGSTMVPTTFSEIFAQTTDTIKSPAAIGASKVNDWFVWSDAGTLRLSHGPDWTNDTTRSTGTVLAMVNGILVNASSITNGPAANYGTYVGTTKSNASSAIDWTFGSSAAGGGAAALNIWNAYNRVDIRTKVNDSAATHNYTLSTIRSWNGGSGMQVQFVVGLNEDSAWTSFQTVVFPASVIGALPTIGLGFDSTSAFSQSAFYQAVSAGGQASFPGVYSPWQPGLGFHTLSALEAGDGTNSNGFGGGGGSASIWNALTFSMKM